MSSKNISSLVACAAAIVFIAAVAAVAIVNLVSKKDASFRTTEPTQQSEYIVFRVDSQSIRSNVDLSSYALRGQVMSMTNAPLIPSIFCKEEGLRPEGFINEYFLSKNVNAPGEFCFTKADGLPFKPGKSYTVYLRLTLIASDGKEHLSDSDPFTLSFAR